MQAMLVVFPNLPVQIVCMMAICFLLGSAFTLIALWLLGQAKNSSQESQE